MERSHPAKLEIVVRDEDVDGIIDVILGHAQTGRSGNGAIYISPVTDAIRVRNGERGQDAVDLVFGET